MGLSATCGLDGFFSGMRTPVFCCDDREARGWGQVLRVRLERPVGQCPAADVYRLTAITLGSYGFASASRSPIFCISSGDHSASFALALAFISVAARL